MSLLGAFLDEVANVLLRRCHECGQHVPTNARPVRDVFQRGDRRYLHAACVSGFGRPSCKYRSPANPTNPTQVVGWAGDGEDRAQMHPETETQARASKRDSNNKRREEARKTPVLKGDEEANAAAGNAMIGIAIALLVIFVVWRQVRQEARTSDLECETLYADDPAGELDCKKDISDMMTFGGLGLFLALLGGVGLWQRNKKSA